MPPEQGQLDATPAEQIARSVVPGARTELYGRTWFIGQVSRDTDVIRGRIGFRAAGSSVELWDEDARDFVPTAVPSGHATPFAIDLSTLRLALQPRPPEINVSPAARAFRAILDPMSSGWAVRYSARRQISLRDWLAGVSQVQSVRATVRRPNPNYEDAHELENILEGAEAELLRLEARADGGLNMGSSFIEQTLRHVERGYGEARVTGYRDGQEATYSTEVGGEETSTEAPADASSGEVEQASLDEALAAPDDEGDTD